MKNNNNPTDRELRKAIASGDVKTVLQSLLWQFKRKITRYGICKDAGILKE